MTATVRSSSPEPFDLPIATQSVKMKIYENIILPFIQCAMGYSENNKWWCLSQADC